MPHNDFEDEWEVVIVKDEGVFGVVLEAGPHVSTVLYCTGGLMYEEIMENEDFDYLEVD